MSRLREIAKEDSKTTLVELIIEKKPSRVLEVTHKDFEESMKKVRKRALRSRYPLEVSPSSLCFKKERKLAGIANA